MIPYKFALAAGLLLSACAAPGTPSTAPSAVRATAAPLSGWTVARSFSLAPPAGNALAPASVVSQGSRLWFTSSHSPAIGEIDLARGVLQRVYDLDDAPGSSLLDVAPSSRALFFGEPGSAMLSRLDLWSGRVDLVDVGLDSVLALCWDPGRSALVASGLQSGTPTLVRRYEDGSVDEATVAVLATSLALSRSGDRLALGGRSGGRGMLVELDADSLDELGRWTVDDGVGSILPDGAGWLFASASGIDRAEGDIVEAVASPGDQIGGLATTSDGALWALRMGVGYDDETGITLGRLYRYDAGVLTMEAEALGGPRGVAAAGPGTAVATPAGDASAVLVTDMDGTQWRVRTGSSPSVVRASPVDPGVIAIVDRLGGEVVVRAGPLTRLWWQADGWPTDLVWDPDGSAFYVYEQARDAVTRVDAATGDATVLFDDEVVDTSLFFGTITLDGDTLFVASGGSGVVRALTTEGTLLWQTVVGATVGRDGPDRIDSMSVGVDDDGQIWVLDTHRETYTVLDQDGVELVSEHLPDAVDNDALFVGDGRVFLGPYEADPATLTVDPDPVVDGERVLAIVDGTLLIDDDEGLAFEGGPVYDHSDRIYGGGYRALWDPGTGGVWLSRFGTAEVELVLPVE